MHMKAEKTGDMVNTPIKNQAFLPLIGTEKHLECISQW